MVRRGGTTGEADARDGVNVASVSLYLLLLGFFAILSALATSDPGRLTQALRGLADTFSDGRLVALDTAAWDSEAQAWFDELAPAFPTPDGGTGLICEGDAAVAGLPPDALFIAGSAVVHADGRARLDALAAGLATTPAALGRRLHVEVGGGDGIAVQRAVALGRLLESEGAPAGTVLVGTDAAAVAGVRLRFVVLRAAPVGRGERS